MYICVHVHVYVYVCVYVCVYVYMYMYVYMYVYVCRRAGGWVGVHVRVGSDAMIRFWKLIF